MRIAVMGAGAVGGYFGSLLARSGNDVTLIARGTHLAAIQARGLRIESVKSGSFVVHCPASDNPAQVGPVHLVFFSTRPHNNAETIPTLRPMLTPDTRILTVQNGVESAPALAAAYGWEHTLPGVTEISSRIKEPGVIAQVYGSCSIILGEHNGKETPSAKRVWQTLKDAGIDARLSSRVFADIWEKLLFNCSIGGFLRLAGAPAGEVYARPDMRALVTGMLREAVSVARAKGVDLSDEVVENTLARVDQVKRDLPSLQRRGEPGRPGEDSVSSASISRMGKEVGVPTPINDVITAVVNLAQERLAAQTTV